MLYITMKQNYRFDSSIKSASGFILESATYIFFKEFQKVNDTLQFFWSSIRSKSLLIQKGYPNGEEIWFDIYQVILFI